MLEGINDKLIGHPAFHGPAHNATGADIKEHGQIQPSLPRPNEGDVRCPNRVRGRCHEILRDEIWRHRPAMGCMGGEFKLFLGFGCNTIFPHQPSYPLPGARNSFVAEGIGNARSFLAASQMVSNQSPTV